MILQLFAVHLSTSSIPSSLLKSRNVVSCGPIFFSQPVQLSFWVSSARFFQSYSWRNGRKKHFTNVPVGFEILTNSEVHVWLVKACNPIRSNTSLSLDLVQLIFFNEVFGIRADHFSNILLEKKQWTVTPQIFAWLFHQTDPKF